MWIGVALDSHTKSPQELIRESNLKNTNGCTGQIHLIGVTPDSRTKCLQDLIWDSNFAYTLNVDSLLDLKIRD
jgi:hypothetical protein